MGDGFAEEDGLIPNMSVILATCGPAGCGEVVFLRAIRGMRGGCMEVDGAAGDGQ